VIHNDNVGGTSVAPGSLYKRSVW